MRNPTPDELRQRLKELEAEKARLKEEIRRAAQKFTVTEVEKSGRPMLEFRRGTTRPIRLGVKKLDAVREGWDQVLAFLAKHEKGPSTNDDVQI